MGSEGGCWLAYYNDQSGMVIFATEIEALRHAVDHSMQVCYWEFGKDVAEASR